MGEGSKEQSGSTAEGQFTQNSQVAMQPRTFKCRNDNQFLIVCFAITYILSIYPDLNKFLLFKSFMSVIFIEIQEKKQHFHSGVIKCRKK